MQKHVKMKSQKEQILAYLRTGGTLTPLESLSMFGCLALSQRVTDLKREGYQIESTLVDVGQGKRVARYSIRQPELFA